MATNLTLGEAAAALGVSVDTLRRWERDGRVTFDYFGAFTQVPGHYTVPLRLAVDAAGGYVHSGGCPSLPLAVD